MVVSSRRSCVPFEHKHLTIPRKAVRRRTLHFEFEIVLPADCFVLINNQDGIWDVQRNVTLVRIAGMLLRQRLFKLKAEVVAEGAVPAGMWRINQCGVQVSAYTVAGATRTPRGRWWGAPFLLCGAGVLPYQRPLEFTNNLNPFFF